MKKDSTAYTVIFSFVVCVFFVFFLALANDLTKDRVASNRRLAERSAVLRALGVPFADKTEVDSVYERELQTFDSTVGKVYRSVKDGRPRYAVNFSGAGLWGTISGVIAFDSTVDRIIGLEIVSHNETPGLGGRIDEPWFKDQFKNERLSAAGVRVRQGTGKGDADPDNGEVDMVTGASRTSQSIETIVNAQIAAFRGVRDAGGLK